MKHPKLSKLLQQKSSFQTETHSAELLDHLQLKMLRIQQGIWHTGRRAIVIFEGFDAAGKGGTIRAMLEKLDPRGVRVEAIGPPDDLDQKKHYLYRFWRALPAPGMITVFDRSWYGRLLVEKVEKLAPEKRIQQAYEEIRNFETMLTQDGIDLVKIFLAVSPEEQLRRFEVRVKDPYKQWKITDADFEAHLKWRQYVNASDELLKKTHTKAHPWHLIPSDSKEYAHHKALKMVTSALGVHQNWIEEKAEEHKISKTNQMMLKAIKKARVKLR